MAKAATVKSLVYKLGQRYRHHARCEASVAEATARWRNLAGKDYRCELGALYKVNGEHMLCKRHAGDYLIQLYLKGDELVTDKPTQANSKQPSSRVGPRPR